jgi:lipopolysaccharide biosynthesis protein
MRKEPSEDLPFMLCWANEAWTREWSGRSGSVIVSQSYSDTDDGRHIEFLLEIFSDKRYIRIDGKPVFLIYQPLDMPDVRRTCDLWRRCAERAGLEGLFLLGVESFRNRLHDPVQLGLDGVVEQQPDLRLVRPAWRAAPRLVASKIGIARRYPALVRFPYAKLREHALRRIRLNQDPRRCPTVSPGWDNSPRRRGRGAVVITGTTPDAYEDWLRRTLELTKAPFVFVNAWNEWAEGAHLEPDLAGGTAYLEAHLRGRGREWKP